MPASRAASARLMPSSAFAMANIRAAAARSGSRRANRRNSAAGTSSRIGKPRPAIRSSRIRTDQNRITAPRVVPTHVRVSGIARRYQADQRRRVGGGGSGGGEGDAEEGGADGGTHGLGSPRFGRGDR